MNEGWGNKVKDFRIKSDQNGIESIFHFLKSSDWIYDKIRPKWDWKLQSPVQRPSSEYMIKSDQNGIESFVKT